uniref:Retrovirus-related Pol polyprotein from transposon TNT 1-94 n=1 Tax=Cannabis sativa TaxID=3483 RepID=A0A803PF04_CANSA
MEGDKGPVVGEDGNRGLVQQLVSELGSSKLDLRSIIKNLVNWEKELTGSLIEKENSEILEKAHNAIILNLGDKVLREVSKETIATGIWLKLESLYTQVFGKSIVLKAEVVFFQDGIGKEH